MQFARIKFLIFLKLPLIFDQIPNIVKKLPERAEFLLYNTMKIDYDKPVQSELG